jgi:hypothetical protein
MKIYLALIAVLGWFALIVQLYLYVIGTVIPVSEVIIRYFSFFTIISNLLVAICTTTLVFRPVRLKSFFSQPKNQTAIVLYILIVGIVYNVILRSLWQPKGMQLVVDELLHSVIPILYFIYWLLFVPKQQLEWSSFWSWLILPLVYLAFILVRGSFSGFYPYPFLEVSKLGLDRVLLNSGGLTVAFFIMSLILIGIAKLQFKAK